MSTAELFIDPEEIDEFVRETLADDSLYFFGEEGREIGICPYVTFYVYHEPDDYLTVADKMIAVYQEFGKLIDEPFQLVWKDDTQDWLPASDKRLLNDQHAQAARQKNRSEAFAVGATDQESVATTACWAISGTVASGLMRYARLKLTFRHKWYNQNKARWQHFVKGCIAQLQPEHCYSGYEVGNGDFNFLGAYECDVLERVCADYFYGMDIDHPSKMGFHPYWQKDGESDGSDLGAGIRTPTWCFLLSPVWLAKLGKTEADVREELNDPHIEIIAIPYATSAHNPKGENGLWIRLGELDLYPVENGVPDLLVKANRLIRPIRCDYLNLLTLDPWDDDPNTRFDYDSSLRWMRRFDDDSDWPDATKRKGAASLAPMAPRMRCPAGQPCPKEGYWITPAKADSRRLFKDGEVMPSVSGDYGDTIWQWDDRQ
jgi:hypothetical protein